jgi:hypothetical protein
MRTGTPLDFEDMFRGLESLPVDLRICLTALLLKVWENSLNVCQLYALAGPKKYLVKSLRKREMN